MAEAPSIQIRIGGVEVTCRGSVDPEQLEEVLRGLKAQLPELMRPEAAAPGGLSAADLLGQSEARTFGEKAGVIAFWLEQHRGRPDWRSGDIVDVLRDLDEATPANITDTLNQQLKKGLFEVNERRWRLTGEGRGWVKYRLLNQSNED